MRDKLPGILIFLLNGKNAQKSASQHYLRNGNQAGVRAEIMAEIARIRPSSALLHPETVDEDEEALEVYDV